MIWHSYLNYTKMLNKAMRTVLMMSIFFCLTFFATGQTKTLIDFFLPMQPQSPLVSQRIWGDIAPRDTANGLEGKPFYSSLQGKYLLKDWCYWDGSIVKGSAAVPSPVRVVPSTTSVVPPPVAEIASTSSFNSCRAAWVSVAPIVR